jgi:hypothetical protein
MKRDDEISSGAPFRLSWTAIFGGLVASTGVWILLYTLGLALGLSSLDFDQPNLLRAFGIGGGVWIVLSSFLSMLAGGIVTARAAGYLGRGNGALHGLVLWGSSGILSLMLLGSMFGSMASGLARTGSDMTSAAFSQMSLDTDSLMEPVNAKLAETGKPPVSAEQVKSIAKDAATTAATRGRFDKEQFVASVARSTQMDPAEVRTLMASTMQQVEQKVDSLRQQAEQSAEQAAQATARAFWAFFALSLTSLLGSVLGASTGVSRRQRAGVTATGGLPPLSLPQRPQREVYP